jgi:hypothetical protein
MTISNAFFHVVNVAGGLSLDPNTWNRVLARNSQGVRKTHISSDQTTLSDAAEQLRRLARYTTPEGTPARLLANALAIVEREIPLAHRKSRSIATRGLSAGGIG